ncbi:Cdc6/Cdc18 family protein [Halobellus sp. EA9]|uniref:Cdc6/Cdc18 family protein n=1 Tax=Halobellus sp. EA9 TaxID=3421647 RepID=UPI003EBDB0A4
MIVRPRVFDDAWPPDELQHREGAVEALSRAFDPATAGREAQSAVVHGPRGVGKTALAWHVVRRLERHAGVSVVLVGALGATTESILRRVIAAAPGHANPSRSATVQDLRWKLRKQVDQPIVLVLDEAEGLSSTDALDHLLAVDRLSIVGIVRREDRWLGRLSGSVRRRIDVSVGLDRYRVDELVAILRTRADRGLAGDPVTDRQLAYVADAVAGIARHGIQSLRAAAALADEREHREIRDADIDDAFARARARIRNLNLRSLPVHHRLVYAVIREAGEITESELDARYADVADAVYRGTGLDPIDTRDRRMALRRLEAYDLIDRDDRTYRASDESISTGLSLPARDLE